MSIFHCSIKIISRSAGRSATSSSAYRSGTKLHDQETGDSRKQGVLHAEVLLCENAPAAYADREALWNAVQKIESQKNAQLAREVEIAIPKEIPAEDRIALVREYVQENFVSQGMCADFALHDKGDGNPHAHILLTTRPIMKNGKWGQKEKKDYARDADGNKIPVIDPETGQQKVRVRKGKGTEKLWQRDRPDKQLERPGQCGEMAQGVGRPLQQPFSAGGPYRPPFVQAAGHRTDTHHP